MKSWEEFQSYCKKLGEYYVHRYDITKLEMLKLASIKRTAHKLDGYWYNWEARLPHKFRVDQIEKLLSFKIDMQYAMDEIYEWVLNFTFPELGGEKSFFTHFAWDSLFWLLNLEYYKRKQRTIFQDYQMPYFDWETFDFWHEEEIKTWTSKHRDEQIRAEFKNIDEKREEYCKQVLQVAVDAVAYLGITDSR
jgi:hypothetical protein